MTNGFQVSSFEFSGFDKFGSEEIDMFKQSKKTVAYYLKQQPYTSDDFVVSGLLYRDSGRPSMLTGVPETGKSTLGLQLALAVARGKPFLDRETVKSKVILWLSEDSDRQIGQALRTSGVHKGEKNLSLLTQEPHVPTWQEALHHELSTDRDVRLCIIETLMDFLDVPMATNSACAKAMKTFKHQFVNQYKNCVLLFLHHNTKSSVNASGPVAAKMMGHTKLWGALDTIIVLEPGAGFDPRHIISATVRGSARITKGIPRTYLEFDKATATATLGEVVDPGGLTEIEFHNQILEYVVQNPGQTKTQVYEGMKAEGNGRDKAKHLAFIDKLVADGHLYAEKGTGSGSPEHIWRAGLEPGGKADTALELVTKGFKQKAKTAHPDAGGTTEEMQDLNEAKNFAEEAVKSAAKKGAA